MTTGNDYEGRFYVDYDPKPNYFEAYAWSRERIVWSLVEVSDALEDLLQKCKKSGFTTFDGLTNAAVIRIHQWLVRDKPTVEYVESLLDGPNSGQSSKCPIGFQRPDRKTSDDTDTSGDNEITSCE